jgi:hypothetical protein
MHSLFPDAVPTSNSPTPKYTTKTQLSCPLLSDPGIMVVLLRTQIPILKAKDVAAPRFARQNRKRQQCLSRRVR